MNPLTVSFEAQAIDRTQFRVLRADLDEELSSPFELRLELAALPGVRLDDLEVIGRAGMLDLELGDGSQRRIPGVVTHIAGSTHEESGSLQWKLTVRPRMESLSLTTTTEVWRTPVLNACA